VHDFQIISEFAKKCRNIWGSVRHKPSAMFKKYSAEHNNGRSIGFIKPSECRMAGEHIALLRLLRLRNALKATVTSKEFIDLKAFKDASEIVIMDDFWSYIFVLCRTSLYAPMPQCKSFASQTKKHLPWISCTSTHCRQISCYRNIWMN
jgi:hypothetical protein